MPEEEEEEEEEEVQSDKTEVSVSPIITKYAHLTSDIKQAARTDGGEKRTIKCTQTNKKKLKRQAPPWLSHGAKGEDPHGDARDEVTLAAEGDPRHRFVVTHAHLCVCVGYMYVVGGGGIVR